jgi:aryl-phospho-beta-D-glucosidase BglC (GH1 family)
MLWDSPYAIRKTAEIWKDIAAHYSKEQSILGYDLLGEPLLPNNRANELVSVYQEISTAFRSVDPNHMIV